MARGVAPQVETGKAPGAKIEAQVAAPVVRLDVAPDQRGLVNRNVAVTLATGSAERPATIERGPRAQGARTSASVASMARELPAIDFLRRTGANSTIF